MAQRSVNVRDLLERSNSQGSLDAEGRMLDEEADRARASGDGDMLFFQNSGPQGLLAPEMVQDEVETERLESVKRRQKFSAIVSEQACSHEQMMLRHSLEEGRRTPRPTERSGPPEFPASPSSSSRGQCFAHSSLQRPASAGGLGPLGTREVNARILADKFDQKQFTNERFHECQQYMFEEQNRNHEAIMSNLDACDRRHERRLQEQAWKQTEKIYVAQQKTNDHEKMLKQIQRDEERKWKDMQEKQYGTQKKQVRPGSSPTKMRATSTNAVSQSEDPRIYVDMCQSHTKFSGALAQMQQYSVDCERRNQRNWQRIAPGQMAERQKRQEQEAREKEEAKNALRKISSVIPGDTAVTEYEVNLEEAGTAWIAAASVYGLRLARCELWQEELETRRLAKLEKDTEKLNDHRARGGQAVNKRASDAGEMVEAWERKEFEAAQRRRSQQTANGEEVFRKHAEKSLAMDEFRDQQQQSLEERSMSMTQLQQTVLSTGSQQMQSAEQDGRVRLENKTVRSSNVLDKKFAGFDYVVRSNAGKHTDKCRSIIQRKEVHEKEFRKQAAVEIKNKLTRSTSALMKVKKKPTAFEGFDAKSILDARRPQSSAGPRRKLDANLCLPPDLVPPSGHFALSNRRPSPDTRIPEVINSSRNAGSDLILDNPFLTQPNHGRVAFSIECDHKEASKKRGNDASPVEFTGQQNQLAIPLDAARPGLSGSSHGGSKSPRATAGARKPSKASEIGDEGEFDSDSEEDECFLQDLEQRSSKWLHEARRKQNKAVARRL